MSCFPVMIIENHYCANYTARNHDHDTREVGSNQRSLT
jgi:hypothetical protein